MLSPLTCFKVNDAVKNKASRVCAPGLHFSLLLCVCVCFLLIYWKRLSHVLTFSHTAWTTITCSFREPLIKTAGQLIHPGFSAHVTQRHGFLVTSHATNWPWPQLGLLSPASQWRDGSEGYRNVADLPLHYIRFRTWNGYVKLDQAASGTHIELFLFVVMDRLIMMTGTQFSIPN